STMNAIQLDYTFENDSYARNDKTIGYEQTELSKRIFVDLFNKNGFPAMIKPNDRIAICVKKNNMEQDFLFDIMNNPNKCQPKYQAEVYNLSIPGHFPSPVRR